MKGWWTICYPIGPLSRNLDSALLPDKCVCMHVCVYKGNCSKEPELIESTQHQPALSICSELHFQHINTPCLMLHTHTHTQCGSILSPMTLAGSITLLPLQSLTVKPFLFFLLTLRETSCLSESAFVIKHNDRLSLFSCSLSEVWQCNIVKQFA